MGERGQDSCVSVLGVQLAICSEHSDEASLCIKRGEFLGWVRNFSLLKRHSAPWS